MAVATLVAVFLGPVLAVLVTRYVDDKRLKRQLRRQQQLNEELRKQLANLTARLENLTPLAPPAAARSRGGAASRKR